jgi:hypothetical protein
VVGTAAAGALYIVGKVHVPETTDKAVIMGKEGFAVGKDISASIYTGMLAGLGKPEGGNLFGSGAPMDFLSRYAFCIDQEPNVTKLCRPNCGRLALC